MRFIIILLLLPSYVSAMGDIIDPDSILDETSYDWNDDGVMDRAYLVDNNPDDVSADLYIEFGVSAASDFDQPVYAPNLVWSGAMAGQKPYLGISERGSLLVFSINESIGRNRWQMTLTLAFRQNQFLVAGFTYSDWDTLDLDAFGTCDFNLLTGKGLISRGDDPAIEVLTLQNAIPADQWDLNIFPNECFE